MDYKGKKVLVVGAGLSGVEATRFLLSKGAHVLLTDTKSRDKLAEHVLALEKQGVQFMLGNVLPEKVDWDMVVASPGVPPGIPLYRMSREAGVEIVGEIELAWREAHAPFIGITGTNGKTTTTALTAYVLEQGKKDILLGGNIGQPLVSSIGAFHGDYVVAELSSFQLESCQDFRCKIAVFLNLSPDHLDRHGTLEAYGAAKSRIFANQQGEDTAIFNDDDAYVRALGDVLPSQVLRFSLTHKVQNGMYLADGRIFFVQDGQERYDFPASSIFIKGKHNIANAMAAALAAHVAGVDWETISHALATFPGVPHRLEFVCQKDGVTYVNDSKGTNPDSTTQALLAYDEHMILLLGGRNKGVDMHPLLQLVKSRDVQPIFFGEALPEFKRAADELGMKNYVLADDFQDAVLRGAKLAHPGDVVVLSPACTSWDAFPNFEARGDRFKEIVREL